MIIEMPCFTRRCKHYDGVQQPDDNELKEVFICKAFPNGIPTSIMSGDNQHSEPLPGQGNDLVYTRDDDKNGGE